MLANHVQPVAASAATSVLLVDDHPVVRMGCRHLLENTPDIRVVAEAEDGESACVYYAQHKPDVMILDLGLPGIGGMEALRRTKAKDPKARILMFSMQDSEAMIMRCLKAGATGYLTKNNGFTQMAEAVRTVARGGIYVDSAHSAKLIAQQLFGSDENTLLALSQREFQVFQMSAEGLSVNDIAATLSISPKTAGAHHANIMKKLGFHNTAQLVRLSMHCGVTQP
jgi:two-component system, NarL family, invasion response regulator UvrY